MTDKRIHRNDRLHLACALHLSTNLVDLGHAIVGVVDGHGGEVTADVAVVATLINDATPRNDVDTMLWPQTGGTKRGALA